MDFRNILEKIRKKELCAAARNQGKIPYTSNGGVFDDRTDDICWWTNGFYAGLLWQLYGEKRCALFRRTAERIEKKLDKNFSSPMGMDHDSGFKWLLTSGASLSLTGNSLSRDRLLRAANDLAGRFNPAGNFIRAWNDDSGEKAGWAIIDCMMNLPLLYRASEMTHDPRYFQIAVRHARTAKEFFVRGDGSCRHICVFDPNTGNFLREEGGQGIGVGSAWTRGQAWAVYGFTLSYLHTGEEEFLSAARSVADFFETHLPASGLVPADFLQDPDCPYEDGSAACIAACGLMELFKATKEARYKEIAEALLTALAGYGCDFSEETDSIVLRCTAAYHDAAHNFPLIYADYFFTEAVLKLLNKETFLW